MIILFSQIMRIISVSKFRNQKGISMNDSGVFHNSQLTQVIRMIKYIVLDSYSECHFSLTIQILYDLHEVTQILRLI